MNKNNLIENVNGKHIEIKKTKHPNDSSKPGLVKRSTKRGNKSDLGDSFVAPDGGWGWLVAIASGVSILVTYPVLQQFGILFRHKFASIGMNSSETTTILNVQQAAAMCSGANFVAPDGGWGWLVAIASGVIVLVTYPVLEQFGILFRNKFSDLGISSSEVTTMINAQQAVAMCSGLINGPLFRRFSHRQAAIIGNCLVFSGLFLAAFANSFIAYFISISILYGIGRGIMFSTMTVAVNTYFKTKRQEATACQYAVAGLGPMILPYVVTFWVSYYGVSGAVLLLSALSLHNLTCSAIYQPVGWHVKKTPPARQLQNLAKTDENSDSEVPSVFATCKLEIASQTHPKNGNGALQNVIVDTSSETTPTEKKPLPEEEELLEKLKNTDDSSQKKSILQRIVKMFDLDLLKDFGFVNIVIGLTLMNIIHMNFHYLTPFILHEFGLDSNQIAAAMTVEAVCSFATKFLIVFVVAKLKCDSKIWLMIGCLAMALGRVILALNRNNIVVLVCFGWIGFSSAILLIFWVLVLPSYVPLNKLPAAIGLHRLIMGIFNLIIGPFIGLIRDATNYSCILHIMNAIIVIVVISWVGEDFFKKRRNRMHKTDQRCS